MAGRFLKDVMYGPLNLGMSEEEAEKSAKESLELVGISGRVLSDESDGAFGRTEKMCCNCRCISDAAGNTGAGRTGSRA